MKVIARDKKMVSGQQKQSLAIQCEICNQITWVWGDRKNVTCKLCGNKQPLDYISKE